MEDEKNIKLKETKSNPDDKVFDGTEVFKTGEVTRIIDEAIGMIEERWNGKPVISKMTDCHEMGKMRQESKESEEGEKSGENSQPQEIDKSDKDWIYKEIIRLENEGKWRELEEFTKSQEFLENQEKEKDWQAQREEYLKRAQYLQCQKEAEEAEQAEKNRKAQADGQKKENENIGAAEQTAENEDTGATEQMEADKIIGAIDSAEENEDTNGIEDTKDIPNTEKINKLKKTKKKKKTDTQSIVKRLKRILIVICLLLAALVAGRIIYVNCTYPSTKINMLNQSQKLTGGKYEMAVNDAVLYSKEKWVEYLKENIPEDEDFDADRYASIPGAGENYDIVCVELSVSNTSDETIEMFDIKMGLVLQSGYQPQGYSIFIREKADDSKLIKNYEVEAGNTREFVFAYTVKEEFKKDLMLQYCELGNNQRMVLELKEVR